MKIIIVCYPTFGGSGVVATELGLYLSKKGHEIHFITYKQPVRINNLSSKLHFHEVHVPNYHLFRYQPYELALSSKILQIVKKFKIELLHVHYAIPHAYAAFMAKKMLEEEKILIPMVTTLHGTDITLVGSHPFYKKAVQFSINKSEYVTAVSNSLKDDTIRLLNISREIHVIPNFIDLSRIDKQVKCDKTIIASKDEFIITHISNFRPLKRIVDVLKIFKKIKNIFKAKLLMVGDGPDKQKALDYCRANNFEDLVVFLGNSNEIDEILCFTDIFLLPSEQESFGLAALEAMAHGIPVVCSDTGGLPEVVKEGYSGFLCPVGDTDQMAQKSIFLLEDSSRLNKFKIQAKKSTQKFNINKIIIYYEKIYKDAIKNYLT